MIDFEDNLTSEYNVKVYNVKHELLGMVNTVDDYVTMWNADIENAKFGTIEKIDNFTFSVTVKENAVAASIRIYGVHEIVSLPQLTAPNPELVFNEITQTTAKANWSENGAAVQSPIGYQWQNTTNPAFSTITNGTGSGSGFPNPPFVNLSGLQPNTNYYFRVRKIDTGLPATNTPSVWVSGTYKTLENVVTPTTHTVYIKAFDTDPFTNENTIIDMSGSTTISLVVNNGSDISRLLPSNFNNKFIVWREISTEPIKNFWNNGPSNNGNLTPNGDAAFRKPFVAGDDRFYVTRDAAGFAFDSGIAVSLTIN